MADKTFHHGLTVGKAAELEMRKWALGLQVQDQLKKRSPPEELPSQIHPYLALSREVGAGGSELAGMLGEKLGWEVLDRQLLDYMANHFNLPGDMLEHVDETTSNWLVEVFGRWMDAQVVTQAQFVVHLGQIALMAARHASTIFVGRGVQFILPRDRGLAVRVIGPREKRVKRIMEVRQLTRTQAKQYIDQHDRGRRDFVKKYFRHDVGEAHIYDLVINSENIPMDSVVDLVAEHLHRCFQLKT
jgi:cytidylate kinase